MFAVVKTGGKQYKVSPGDILEIERLEGEAGQNIDLASVLLINDEGKISIGAPLLETALVRASIVDQTRGKKIIVFKKKRRQGYRRKAGHRQDLTLIRIEDIFADGSKAPAKTNVAPAVKTVKAETVPPAVKTPSIKETAPAPSKKEAVLKKETEMKETSSKPNVEKEVASKSKTEKKQSETGDAKKSPVSQKKEKK